MNRPWWVVGLALIAGVSGCATVRDRTLPATTKPLYDLHAFTVRPPADTAWRLNVYNPWEAFVLFGHADAWATLGAWWVPVVPEEIQHAKAETVVAFFRDDMVAELKMDGDYDIPDASGWEESTLSVAGQPVPTLHLRGMQGPRRIPFEAWVAYRGSDYDAGPQMEVLCYVRKVNANAPGVKVPLVEPTEELRRLMESVAPRASGSPWIRWQRASAVYSRFLNRWNKRAIAKEHERLMALYQASQREVRAALAADAERAELHDLAGLLACYNTKLEFLGEGMEAAAAEAAFKRAIELRPNLTSAREHLARLHETAGRLDEALREQIALSEISPNTAEYHYQRGKLLERMKRTKEALETYRQAARVWVGAAGTKAELDDTIKRLDSAG